MPLSDAREITLDEPLPTDTHLDLDLTPRERLRFVTGAVAARGSGVTCGYCGGLVEGSACDGCGAPVAASEVERPSANLYPVAIPGPDAMPPARSDRGAVWEAIAGVPLGFWKRVPVYALLAMVLGNGCLCGGLSGGTNGALAVLALVGLFGWWVASAQ